MLRLNLHLKIMAALAAAFLPIVLFTGVLPMWREREFLMAQDRKRASDLLRSLSIIAGASVRTADNEPFKTLMNKTFADDRDVIAVKLFDAKQAVLCQVGPRAQTTAADSLQSTQTVFVGREDAGRVELVYSLASSREGLESLTRLVFVTAIDCVLFLGLVLHVLLKYLVTNPLAKLKRLAGLIAAGDLSQRIEENRGDELGAVARSFNTMTDALGRSRAQVEQANRELEDRVKERTEQLKVEVAKVQRAERLSTVGTLAAGIAHELNNPIGNISTFSQLLLEREQPDPAFLKKGLNTISSETQRAGKIIRGLLDFARPAPSQRVELNLSEVIEAVLKVVVPAFSSRATYAVDVAVAADAPPVSADGMQLQQVFINILTNAFQAMPEGGRVSVKLATKPVERSGTHFVVCEIADNGPGIKEADLPHVFDPFFTTKQVGSGTGLGLSVSYGILQEHGGLMEVRSGAGEGATFSVLVPVAGTKSA